MAETIDQTQTRLEAFVVENFPAADIAPGSVISELVIKLAASLSNEISNQIETASQQKAVVSVIDSAVSTYSPIMDEIASNYNTTRNSGSKSTGKVKMSVSVSRSYIVPTGFRLYQPALDLYYVTTQDYAVRVTPSSSELQLFNQNGVYYFILPVEAELVGSVSQVSNLTPFQLASNQTMDDFVGAAAYGSFSSGLAEETDQDLITRFKVGLSNKSFHTPVSILSNLQGRFPGVQTLSCVGAGDAEFTRTKNNILGISTFGGADVYVRSSIGLETTNFTASATKLSTGKWQMSLGADQYPGFYKVVTLRPLTTDDVIGSLVITSQTFGYSVPDTGRVNEVSSATEARFSKYQTATILFDYDETPGVAVNATQDFDVTISRQPSIDDMQALFLDDSNRLVCADYMVKAVLPCFVSMSMRIVRKNPTDVIPTESIKQDIFNYVNTIPFGESLYASKIIDIVHNYSIKQVDLPIVLNGSILTNNTTVLTLTNGDLLTIPESISNGVSKNTTMFFLDYYEGSTDNIGIEVV